MIVVVASGPIAPHRVRNVEAGRAPPLVEERIVAEFTDADTEQVFGAVAQSEQGEAGLNVRKVVLQGGLALLAVLGLARFARDRARGAS